MELTSSFAEVPQYFRAVFATPTFLKGRYMSVAILDLDADDGLGDRTMNELPHVAGATRCAHFAFRSPG